MWDFAKPLSLYHPNLQEKEMEGLDVARFLASCTATGAEAVVVSAGGLYAFYRTKVAEHVVATAALDRDLLAEIVEEARPTGLRVIARLDFSRVRTATGDRHPDWLFVDRDGLPRASDGRYLATCPTSPYQNEAFARLVIEELLTDYGVDGFHLNAGGFDGPCFCGNCRRASGLALDTRAPDGRDDARAFEDWRCRAFAEQMERYGGWMRAIRPDCLFMAELSGLEYRDWMRDRSFRFGRLSQGFSHVLVATGGMKHARSSRCWPAMSTDLAACAGRPLANVKLQMRDIGAGQALLPAAEILADAYQVVQRGGGLKMTHFDLPDRLPDPRGRSVVREVFAHQAAMRDHLEGYRIHAPVRLVWPESRLTGRTLTTIERLSDAFKDLYASLVQRHVPFGVSLDDGRVFRSEPAPAAVVFPYEDGGLGALGEGAVRYVEEGGFLLLVDVPPDSGEGFGALADPLLERLLGARAPTGTIRPAYALADAPLADDAALRGPLPAGRACRDLSGLSGDVWLESGSAYQGLLPEDFEPLRRDGAPLLVVRRAGAGRCAFCALPIGNLAGETGLGDYAVLLERILAVAGVPPLDVDAASSVMATLADTAEGQVLSLLQTSGTVPMNDVQPSAPIRCSLAADRAASVVFVEPGAAPRPLSFALRDGRIEFVVPRLALFGQVVVT